jgi:methyl-accepting chemotaxis protein
MTTQIATALATGTAEAAGSALADDLASQLGAHTPALIMVFGSTEQPLGALGQTIGARFPGTVVLGASTAGEFTERGDAKRAACAVAVAGDFQVFAGMSTGLKANVEGAVARAVMDLPREVAGYPHRTAILLVDPLAGNGEEATLVASALLGAGVRLAGGAAGDDLKMAETHVSVGPRAASDAVVVAALFSKEALGVGVCHGHVPMSEPMKVTRADGNVVREIEGKPAWGVWAQATKIDGEALPDDKVLEHLLRYEAGLASGQEYKIRAPLSRAADGSISFACGIPEGSVIRITESQPQRQIDSARTAARRAVEHMGGAPVAGAIVFDCICRNLILGDGFSQAVAAIHDELGKVPLAGFETYGEIALDAGDMSGFHNTTTVVLAFPR